MKSNDCMVRNIFFPYLALMMWEVDGHEINVLVSEKVEVEILQWTENKKVVQVPVRMNKIEAIWTIHNLSQKKFPDRLLSVAQRLDVFDKNWPIKPSINKQTPYIKDGIIHCYMKRGRLSTAENIKIKEELLQQFVLCAVGQWEEMFDMLVPHITFRKNKTKPYIVQQAKERICFDKDLYNLSLEVIAYCVFKAFSVYGSLDESMRKRLIEKYYPTWKTLEKITLHAYTTHVNY